MNILKGAFAIVEILVKGGIKPLLSNNTDNPDLCKFFTPSWSVYPYLSRDNRLCKFNPDSIWRYFFQIFESVYCIIFSGILINFCERRLKIIGNEIKLIRRININRYIRTRFLECGNLFAWRKSISDNIVFLTLSTMPSCANRS